MAAAMDGATLSLTWGIPFAGILLSIALFPLALPRFWHAHYGKIVALWTVVFLGCVLTYFGLQTAVHIVAHALLTEYIPFFILLFTLYTISGGILVWGNREGSVKLNLLILGLGAFLASLMGTTGAAMLLIRPLLRANEERQHKVHVIIFFIFIVANVGGGLTPLGDPPLFLGFLKGVTFAWTFTHMLLPVVILLTYLLIMFAMIDTYFWRKDPPVIEHKKVDDRLTIKGRFNFILIIIAILAIVMSGNLKTGVTLSLFDTPIALEALLRDIILLSLAAISMKWTPKQVRAGNEFNWEPIAEVGKLFLGIFITIAPVIEILKAGTAGHMAPIIHQVSDVNGQPLDFMYFMVSGLLSAFLDNAPTYLVFFNLASGDATHLMTELSSTLLAISMGSVFMGALTYIGNAPNMMVKAISEQRRIQMPSFFGYLAWSVAILGPGLLLLGVLFFRH
jgi:Na+/H+ antiporter NhaD/arsenite permease-like protein